MTATDHKTLQAQWRYARHSDVIDRIDRLSKELTDAERGASLLLKHCDGLIDAKVIEGAETTRQEVEAALKEVGAA